MTHAVFSPIVKRLASTIVTSQLADMHGTEYKKAQLSLTNPRDAIACKNCPNSTCLQRCR